MLKIKLETKQIGYPDGFTPVEYEPGVHKVPDSLARTFEVSGMGVIVESDDSDDSDEEPTPAPAAKRARRR